ncbi:EF-hand domain-containing protein [Donghicola eburneus]|uniref:Calcium-binding protein n=1 Tax=Donghicola eburneus TaxID=393278 RepID=A0A1M4MX59_9RHOB|nr:EF-hand domain-containing protein [Donghicola eburneus]SCM67152.1 calcium-binding protein [Donghicola eburneus]SFQ68941.1 Ca2+-binding protein, EF-hand superfamily [Donghicola eburneus]
MTKTSTKIVLGLAGLAASAMLMVTTAQARPGGMMGHGDRPAFAELDANADGEVSAEEFEAFRAAKFAEADTDGDGALSPDEMVARMEAQRAEQMRSRMLQRFDTDGDGKISPEEMAAKRPGDMIQKMDKDGNGTISEEEFAAMERPMMRKGDGPRGMKNTCESDGGRHGGGERGEGGKHMPRCQ